VTLHRAVNSMDLEKLRRLDTCTVSNAIERFNVRMRNEGFVSGEVKCRFRDLPPMIGYAATARIRTAEPPMGRDGCYYDRMDWWSYVTLPFPVRA
jgi:4-hydroxy-4-methyl-2-oxoglutarate aldolase